MMSPNMVRFGLLFIVSILSSNARGEVENHAQKLKQVRHALNSSINRNSFNL